MGRTLNTWTAAAQSLESRVDSCVLGQARTCEINWSVSSPLVEFVCILTGLVILIHQVLSGSRLRVIPSALYLVSGENGRLQRSRGCMGGREGCPTTLHRGRWCLEQGIPGLLHFCFPGPVPKTLNPMCGNLRATSASLLAAQGRLVTPPRECRFFEPACNVSVVTASDVTLPWICY